MRSRTKASRPRTSSWKVSTVSGAGGLALGSSMAPIRASMRASTLSVLASWPKASANSRERSGLTTATA